MECHGILRRAAGMVVAAAAIAPGTLASASVPRRSPLGGDGAGAHVAVTCTAVSRVRITLNRRTRSAHVTVGHRSLSVFRSHGRLRVVLHLRPSTRAVVVQIDELRKNGKHVRTTLTYRRC